MSLNFGEPKSINVGNMKIISIKTEEGRPLYVRTEKCFSFGVSRDKKFKTTSMSMVLDENSVEKLEDVIDQCEKHLGPLLFLVFYNDLTDLETNSRVLKYVDDTIIYCSEKDVESIEADLTHDMDLMAKYLEDMN